MSLADDVPGCTDAEEIGSGGYGRVYRARQPAFDRTVAVKVLHGRLDDADTLRRFQRECQAIGAVAGHPNIVAVHDAGGTPSGHPYIVMPYLGRGSLAERLRSGPLPWQQAVQIGVKIAGALHSAHRAGVLHRDIKPENILVSDYGEPQLADFGIAHRLGSAASTSTVAALTPAQGAPELLSGQPPSAASDVYSLASTIHTLIRGLPPFARPGEESVYPMLARIATEPPPDLRQHTVPDAVARVVERGMAKAPQDRPGSALGFGRELQHAQAEMGLPVTPMPLADQDDDGGDAPTPANAEPAPPALPRRPAGTAARVATVATALVVVAAVGLLVRSAATRRGSGPGPAGSVDVQRSMLTTADLGPGDWHPVALRPGTDQAFCGRALPVGQGTRGIVTMRRTSPTSIVSQQAAVRADGGAVALLAAVRTSARVCTTWTATEAGGTAVYQVSPRTPTTRIGDDAAEFWLTRTAGDQSFHVVQVYVVAGDVLSVVSYAIASPITSGDVAYAEGLARTGSGRLAIATRRAG
ncbi:MAG TPA: serine/threonine-protein kinase [Kineosporiaceae bacterium]